MAREKKFATIEEAKKHYRDKYEEYASMLEREYGLVLTVNIDCAELGPLRSAITGEWQLQRYGTNAIDFVKFELDILAIEGSCCQFEDKLEALKRVRMGSGHGAICGGVPDVYFEHTWLFAKNGFIVEPTDDKSADDGTVLRRWHSFASGMVAASVSINPFSTEFELSARDNKGQLHHAVWYSAGPMAGGIGDDAISATTLIALKNFQDELFEQHADDFLWRNVGRGWLNCLGEANNKTIGEFEAEKQEFYRLHVKRNEGESQ